MDNKCDKYIEMILSSDGDYPDPVMRHICDCHECRAVASEWRTVRLMAKKTKVKEENNSQSGLAIIERLRRSKAVLSSFKISYVAGALITFFIIAIFMFSDKRPGDNLNHGVDEALLSWTSPLDYKLFEINTELELNIETLSENIPESTINTGAQP
jgi:hypothetical protein